MAGQDEFKHVDNTVNTPLDYENELFDVVNSVSGVAAKFSSLGMALGLKSSALDKIKSENPRNVDEALQDVIKKWMSRACLISSAQSVKPSWRVLAAAVAAPAGGSNPALADTIAAAHPVKKAIKKEPGEGKAGPSASGSATKRVSKQSPSAATSSKSTVAKGTSSSSASSMQQSADKKSTTKPVTTPPTIKSGGSSTAPQKVKQPTAAAADGSTTELQTIPKDLFVTPPMEESICKKCGDVPREPMHPSCCKKKPESMVCGPCSEKSKCSYHKKKPERWILDQTLKNKISKWTMKCPNKCGEKFLVNKHGEHLKQCAKKPKSSASGKKRPSEASKIESSSASKKPKLG